MTIMGLFVRELPPDDAGLLHEVKAERLLIDETVGRAVISHRGFLSD
jgi:hypothetical protein